MTTLGFFCAKAGAVARVTIATDPSNPSQTCLDIFIIDFLNEMGAAVALRFGQFRLSRLIAFPTAHGVSMRCRRIDATVADFFDCI
jgi:hypothetical protein